ncbi:hypothetical protein KFZ76_20625 [Methylovulum psychrotolerans]|uniref:hypothetical protein n=1 Tax=Methylovulum psychrotolerans TaxID=1704499 RepID=UPI001BFF2932|nr:hypothetical protein [Methylovulum psychrotolerans]MBT9100112.1 hypothetical protein [Methylovulum psychrotolerans]
MLKKTSLGLMLLLLCACDFSRSKSVPPPAAPIAHPPETPLKWVKVDTNKLSLAIERLLQAKDGVAQQRYNEKLAQLRAAQQEVADLERPGRQKCAELADEYNPVMQCIKSLQEEPAILAALHKQLYLRAQLATPSDLHYLEELASATARLTASVLKDYSAQHDYALILHDYPPDVLYSSQPVTDITDDVLDFLQQTPDLLADPPVK